MQASDKISTAPATGTQPAEQPAAFVEPIAIRSADSLLAMVCSALTLLMIPALGLFYGGMVRRKNVLATFQQSFILLGFVCVQWVVMGYSLSFGPDLFAGLCGGWQWVCLWGVGLQPSPELCP